jgi:hypothetical protein
MKKPFRKSEIESAKRNEEEVSTMRGAKKVRKTKEVLSESQKEGLEKREEISPKKSETEMVNQNK